MQSDENNTTRIVTGLSVAHSILFGTIRVTATELTAHVGEFPVAIGALIAMLARDA